MSANAAVVIPAYKENLTELEKISLAQVKKILGEKYPIIFVAPEGKVFSYFSAESKIVYFQPKFFESILAYNQLMMTAEFYKSFLAYEYILIYQLDAFVFSDKLEYFCASGYDNIGAAWPLQWVVKINSANGTFRPRVGNGGFCLRNVKACFNLLEKHSDLAKSLCRQLPEDVFFAYCGMEKNSGFRTAPVNVAYKFSAEFNPARVTKKNGGELPFGCHAWHKFGADFYLKIFSSYGYEIEKIKNLMRNGDGGLFNWLVNVAYRRLDYRLNKNLPISQYISKVNFASVRVIRTPYNMLILARLLLENNSLSDKIFFYGENEQDILICDLKPEKLPHLILTKGGGIGADTPFVELLQQKGLTYGNRFMTFHREYLNYCEKIFHNLGR